jgi:hypothetical protein
LQRIYVALEDFDSLAGVSATRKKKPSPYEEILQKLAIGNKEVGQRLHKGINHVVVKNSYFPTVTRINLKTYPLLLSSFLLQDAATKFRVMMQTDRDFLSEHSLVQAYISIEQPQMAITILNGISSAGYSPALTSPFILLMLVSP